MVSNGWTQINLDPIISQSVRKEGGGWGEKKKNEAKFKKKTKQRETTAKTKEAENRKWKAAKQDNRK